LLRRDISVQKPQKGSPRGQKAPKMRVFCGFQGWLYGKNAYESLMACALQVALAKHNRKGVAQPWHRTVSPQRSR
jgi:hypothetical protein